jgi:hypothetical protein
MRAGRAGLLVGLLLPLAGCVLPPADQPADPARFGRFAGLIGRCGCTDLGADQVTARIDRLVAGRPAGEARIVGSYARLGAEESWDNQMEICAEVCAQRCMVAAVAGPLGAAGPLAAPCPVTERDLHLTEGRATGWSPF